MAGIVKNRAILVVAFDITELTEDERETLTGEILAQAEYSKGDDGHPSVDVVDCSVEIRQQRQ